MVRSASVAHRRTPSANASHSARAPSTIAGIQYSGRPTRVVSVPGADHRGLLATLRLPVDMTAS